MGIIFYGLILGHHELIFSYAQVHKYLKFSFWGCVKLFLKEFKWEKVNGSY